MEYFDIRVFLTYELCDCGSWVNSYEILGKIRRAFIKSRLTCEVLMNNFFENAHKKIGLIGVLVL